MIWKKAREIAYKWLAMEDKDPAWMEKMRGNLATVATVIATMTYQVGLNPPGGFVQSGDKGIVDCPLPNEWIQGRHQACPGHTIVGAVQYGAYFRFMLFNNISFFSSLIVCLGLISGLPLDQPLPVWLMAASMCISLASLSLTYACGVQMIMPPKHKQSTAVLRTNSIIFWVRQSVTIWLAVVAVVGFFLVLRFVLLFVKILTNKSKESPTRSDETHVDRSS